MRTNVVIDDALIAQAMQRTGIQTKKAVIEEALRLLVEMNEQKAMQQLFGKLKWEGDLDEMRQGRFLSSTGGDYTENRYATRQGVVLQEEKVEYMASGKSNQNAVEGDGV